MRLRMWLMQAPLSAACCACACRAMDDARGSEVSRCGFQQDQPIQSHIRNRSAQSVILLLKALQFLQLDCSHAALDLCPRTNGGQSLVAYASDRGLFGQLQLPDRINTRQSLAVQYRNLPQLRDNLFWLVSLDSHL